MNKQKLQLNKQKLNEHYYAVISQWVEIDVKMY